MILDNFTDKQNIAYADILEAMICQNTREEKDFDEQERLSERRLYNGKRIIFREIYDYKRNYVHKKLYPYGQEIVHLIYPIYTEQAQRELYLPIKERILALGFQPEAITKIAVRLKNYNEKGQKLQETYNWCKGFFAERGSMGIDNIRYDDRRNIYSSEGFNAYWNEKRNILRTIDLNGRTLIKQSSWDADAFNTVEVYGYDDKNLDRKIISNREGITNIIDYSKGKSRVRIVKLNPKKPFEYKEEGYTQTIKKGAYTYKVERYYYGDSTDLRKSLIVLDNEERIVREKKTNYITKRKKNKEGKQTFRNIKTDEHISRYYYNEQGVLTKEIHLSTDRSVELEVLLYNSQGQKTVRIYRSKDLKQEVKCLEKTVYTYDDKGRLLLESSPTHLTHHFYTLAEDYDEHLEITVKTEL